MSLGLEIKKGAYYDSVTLMVISKEIKKMEGINEALVGMGTDLNKELLANLNMSTPELQDLTTNDFFIAILSDEAGAIDKVKAKVNELLTAKKQSGGSDYNPPTLDSALKHAPESNMVVISLPGKHAPAEVRKALNNGLNVMLFSDNVSVEDEKSLKELAREKGLLMMGPDCGTAIINNVPLAFANVIRKGNIGIVGASGTGTQEVSVMIHKLGGGVSQVIGTGGRDLKLEIGGIMMMEGIKALSEDENTKVIVLISKPPAAEIAEQVLELVKKSGKPVVVDFIGGDVEMIKKHGLVPAFTLEDAAYKAVALANGEEATDMLGFSADEKEINAIVEAEVAKMTTGQKYLRGLYTGGTLCDEAMKMLSADFGDIYSNIPLKDEYALENVHKSVEHTAIDLGDDAFTVGKPHPMIDPSNRFDRLKVELADEEVAVVLMDFVIGYGSNPDPAGEMLPAIEAGRKAREEKGLSTCIIGSVCGTDQDPQNQLDQEQKLRDAGVIIMPSNAQAVRLAAKILKGLA